jgi:hypothetical protein
MAHPGGCSCCADAWVDDATMGSEDLNQYIDVERVRPLIAWPRAAELVEDLICVSARPPQLICLNELHDGAARRLVQKGWCHKAEPEPRLETGLE